jgi:hypothetical protein
MSEDGQNLLPIPRDEREVQAEFNVGLPSWLPGGRFGVSYRRLWDKRGANFINQAADAAGLEVNALADRIEDGDGFSDVFASAARQAIADGDPARADTLARLVAAALFDDARIHVVSYVLSFIESLQPIHIRIINALRSQRRVRQPQTDAKIWYTRSLAEVAREVKALPNLVIAASQNIAIFYECQFHEDEGDLSYRRLGLAVTLEELIDEVELKLNAPRE